MEYFGLDMNIYKFICFRMEWDSTLALHDTLISVTGRDQLVPSIQQLVNTVC